MSDNRVEIDLVAVDQATATVSKVDASLGGLDKTTKTTSTSASGLAGSLGLSAEAAATLATAAAIAGVAIAAMKKSFELGEEAAQMERLTAAGVEMASQYGGNMDLIVQKVKEASLGTVSEMDIIASSNKAMMLGLGADADQLANLMEVAAFRGRAMGVSTTQAFDDIVRGIGRASPMILDNLGIIIDADSTYSAYADGIGKSANELTKQEKTQALLNATLNTGNEMLGKAGGLADDNAASYERWDASLQNTKNSLIENTLEMSRFADMGSTLLDSFTAQTEGQNLGEMFLNNATGANAFAIAIDFLEERVRKQNEALAGSTVSIQNQDDALYAAQGTMMDYGAAAELTADQLKEMTAVNKDLYSLTQNLQNESEKYNDSLATQVNKQEELGVALGEATAQFGAASPKVSELQTKYDEAGVAIDNLKAKHADAMMSIAYNLLVAKLQADGFTDAEFSMAMAAGVSMGQIDQSTATMAANLNEAANAALATNDVTTFENALPGILGVQSATEGAAGGIEAAGASTAGAMTVIDEGTAKADALTNSVAVVGTTATDKMKNVQKAFDSLNTSKAVAQIDNVTAAVNAIPTSVNVAVTQTTTTTTGTGHAAGGIVNAPGDGTKDTMLIPMANGEYVVNAKAARQPGAMAMLEAINSGQSISGLGTGGGSQIINIYGAVTLEIQSADAFTGGR